jgi:dTMP kinase
MEKAPFIAFEGIDKSGKGTQSLIAADLLKAAWGDVVHFSEPNDRDSLIGRHIRKILKREESFPPTLADFQRLYVIDRAQDTVSTVLPALAKGIPVVAERFAMSTLAYGMLEGDMRDFVRMHHEVLGSWLRWPDLTIVIDIPAVLAMERLGREKGKPEYFERADRLSRIRNNYATLAASAREWAPGMRVVGVDGVGSVQEVAQRVADILKPYHP